MLVLAMKLYNQRMRYNPNGKRSKDTIGPTSIRHYNSVSMSIRWCPDMKGTLAVREKAEWMGSSNSSLAV